MEEQIIFKAKQAAILLSLRDYSKDWSISELAKASKSTYVHSCNFIKSCEEHGLVVGEKHGKAKTIKLTEKGKSIADSVWAIYSLLNSDDGSVQTRTTA